ncbi:MAG: hypothetical protein LCH39_01690 [Proteobacteria bacterium]|nr:hypothetical protein [Pseudomonadota bacterium]
MPKLDYMVPADAGKPEWANSEHTQLNITVVFPHLGGEAVRYTAARSDPGWEHSEELFARAADGEFGPVAPFVELPPAPPDKITRAQYGREMRSRGLFSQAEAVAFVTGAGIPAALQALLDTIKDQTAREDAELLVLGAASIERHHPLTALMASGMGWSGADTDDFFRAAGAR